MPSLALRDILRTMEHIALSDMAVLIVGEAGIEKGWLAKTMHELSGRADRRFFSLDCSSISDESMPKMILGYEDLTLSGVEIHEGILEQASGGTLFLDNIASLSPEVQKRTARIIEHQQFRRVGGSEEIMTRVRFIFGVTSRFGGAADGQRPDRDISFRMCPVIINLPPLRKRTEDIPFLIEKYVSEFSAQSSCKPHGISAGALRVCLHYDWPGNADELKSVVEQALRICSDVLIQVNDLPLYIRETVESDEQFGFTAATVGGSP